MMEMVVFALVLVFAQLIGSLIVGALAMKYFMSKHYIKKCTKMMQEVTQEVLEEMEENF